MHPNNLKPGDTVQWTQRIKTRFGSREIARTGQIINLCNAGEFGGNAVPCATVKTDSSLAVLPLDMLRPATLPFPGVQDVARRYFSQPTE